MEPDRFRELCLLIFGPGWHEAITLCTGIKAPGRIASGKQTPSVDLAAWLEMLAAGHHPRLTGALLVADALGADVGLTRSLRWGNSPKQNGQPNGS